jgi:VWFA-related protein
MAAVNTPYRWLVHSLLALLLLQASASQTAWEEKNRAGEQAFQTGRLDQAEALFLEALREAQKLGPEDSRLAAIYNNLASIAFIRNNFISAESLYQKAIALMEPPGHQTQAQDNPLLQPVFDNLTMLYVKEWAFSKAIQTSWRAYHIRTKKFGPASLDAATGLSKLANLYFENVRLLPQSPGESPTEQPASAPAQENPPLSDAAMENATSPDDATKLSFAESLYRRALAIQEKLYGEDNARLVDVLNNLGEVLEAENNVPAAEQVNSRNISIVEKAYGPDDFRLALPLQHNAELQEEQGDLAGAEKLYARSLQINDNNSERAASSLPALLTEYADLLEKLHRPDEAKKLTDRATALAAQKPAKTLKASADSSSVPYVLRFEKSNSDRDGIRQTCMLVRADGHFRFEEHQRTAPSRPTTPSMPKPEDMGMGDAPPEVLSDRPGGNQVSKVFENSLDQTAFQQLSAILSASDIRGLEGSYARTAEHKDSGNEEISASILREDGVQNFAFPDNTSLRPHEAALKPLNQWLTLAEKHKGSAVKGAAPNNCSPETPKAPPMQLTSSKLSATPRGTLTLTAAAQNPPNQKTPENNQNAPPVLKIQSNLVLVRVVARDAEGHAVGTLQQNDFQLLDNRKPREIVSFSVERTNAESQAASATPITTPIPAASAPTPPESSNRSGPEQDVLYLFDDIHLTKPELDQLRRAEDTYLSSSQSHLRFAILTTSGKTTLDFTDDRQKIAEILSQIDLHPAAQSAAGDCPDMDVYTANLIVKGDEDALGAITEDTIACAFGGDPRKASAAESMAKTSAQQHLAFAHTQDRIILSALLNAFHLLLAAPGHRTLVLVSPGFVLPDNEQDFDRIIDDALHSDIVVSTLDTQGLDVNNSIAHEGFYSLQLRQAGQVAKNEILSNLAEATGGAFFHDNNDIAAGFSRTAEIPEYSYVLGFSPEGKDLDGRFHTLKVTVKDLNTLTLQARKGYQAQKQ